jgi:hypothetical protein
MTSVALRTRHSASARELRAVGALAAFDLNKLRDRLRAEAGEI